MITKSPTSKIIAILSTLVATVSGHGYMKSPRSRNFVAYEDGVWWGGGDSHPKKESCPHCLNLGGTLARCGITGGHNYDYPKNYNEGPLEWSTQAFYAAGSTIDIESVLTAHHKGHIEVKACPVEHPGQVASQACFDAHPLVFVSDELYGAPKDVNYPERAYIAPKDVAQNDNTGVSGKFYSFKFKLPSDISGHVLLQWHYITGNSCTAEGYSNYPFPSGWEPSASVCPYIPEDGIGVPEQFWNCGEVFVTSDGPPSDNPPPTSMPAPPIASPSSAPVPVPTPSDPTASPIVGSPRPTILRPPSPPNSDKTIVGYYASWQQYDRGGLGKPENMDFSKVDRVNFAFFQTDTNGYIYGTDSWGDPLVLFGPQSWMGTNHCSWDSPNQKTCNNHEYDKGLISLVHAAGGGIYPSIGGWTLSNTFPAVAASASARTTFATQCAELIQDYHFDGIDIDWEYPGYSDHSGTPQDKENFNLLLDEIRSKLDNLGMANGRHYGLTAALPCGPSHIANIDIPHISSVLDELLLMSYDLHGPWEPVTGVNAPLYYQGHGDMRLSVDSCVKAWKDGGTPSSKIGLGLAFYGRSFAYASGLNTPHSGTDTNNWSADDGIPQYFSIMDKLDAMTSVRHDVSKTPFAFFNNGNGFVSYDDERSICEKTEYAIDYGLNGFLIWELSSDLMPDLSTPLLDMVNNKLANPAYNCAGGGELTNAPSPSQTWHPTVARTQAPIPNIFDNPPLSPTSPPTKVVTNSPTSAPNGSSTPAPTSTVTSIPTKAPTLSPTSATTSTVTNSPTKAPSGSTPSCPSGFTGLIASQTCSHYQHCVGGSPVGNFLPCYSGTLFDESMQNCNHDYSVWCNGVPPAGVPLCPNDNFIGLMAVDNCAGYRHCYNGIVTSAQVNCAEGTLFDESIQNCNWANQVTCGSRRNRTLRGSSNETA